MKIVVTGASGVLGHHLCECLQQKHRVTGIINSYPDWRPSFDLHRLDISNHQKLSRFLDHAKPDAIIHTAALSQPEFCEHHQALSYTVNVSVPRFLAHYTQENHIRYIFTSTDLVFDGEHAPYSEYAHCQPLSIYGCHKYQAEKEILKSNPNAVICRLPLLFGLPLKHRTNLISNMMEKLMGGETVSLFTDEYRTPVSVITASRGLLSMLAADGGVYHLGGSERMSRYEFGKVFCKVFSFSDSAILPCRQSDMTLSAPRPADVSLTNIKAANLGYCPESVSHQLKVMKRLL